MITPEGRAILIHALAHIKFNAINLVPARSGGSFRLMITAFHAKYFAHELTRCFPTDNAEKLAGDGWCVLLGRYA